MSARKKGQAADVIRTPPQANGAKPFPPSFIDGLMDVVERLPVPYGLTYFALFVLQSAVVHILAWSGGWAPRYSFDPLILLYPLWLWGSLAIMTHLDSVARQTLASFRPLLKMRPEALSLLEYEFTTMPARGVLISGVIWSVIYFGFNYLAFGTFFAARGIEPGLTAIVILEGLVSYFIGSAIYYHSVRQLGLVHRTVRMVQSFDLFRLDSVYAFSTLTSRTGIAWVLLLTSTLLFFPIEVAEVPVLMLLVVQVGIAIAAFALPLWIVHQRLVAEKRRLQAEHGRRVETALHRLHRCVDDSKLAEVDRLNSALTGLKIEAEILAKIPTWPWRAGLLTGFLSIVVLPIALFLIQRFLGDWLGR